MKNFVAVLFLLFFLGCSSAPQHSDHYKNFADLKKNESESAFKVDFKKRQSDVLVLAPHGGFIELGTSEIAKSLAGKKWSYYSFEGQLKSGNSKLHITSSRFDEPTALSLVKEHEVCLSVHGYKGQAQDPNICFGGRNDELGGRIQQSLRKLGLQNTDDFNGCGKFYGQDESNIVNKCELEGVQMELSKSFRDELLANKKKLRLFNKAIREVVKQYFSEVHQ